MLTRNSADARNCASPNQILTKPVALSVSLRSDWDNHKVEFWWHSYPRPHYYAFQEEASVKVQGIKGSTSETQGPDGTLSATSLNSVKMILEGFTRLRTKVMELNPNFIQHLNVESLLTLFVENVFSSIRGGNTDTRMMLDFCLRFPQCINELLKLSLIHIWRCRRRG